MKPKVILAEDDESIRFIISKYLTRNGYVVQATDNPDTLLKWIEAGDGDVVISDVHLGIDDIFDFIPVLNEKRPELPIIIISANSSVATALKSANSGVFDYIPKPFDLKALGQTVERAFAQNKLIRIKKNADSTAVMLGRSVAMQPVFRAISDYTSANIAVGILGDVGTGKNLVAQMLHNSGQRQTRPYVSFQADRDLKELAQDLQNGDLLVDNLQDFTPQEQRSLSILLAKNEQKAHGEQFRVLTIISTPEPDSARFPNLRTDLHHLLMAARVKLPRLKERLEDIESLGVHFLEEYTQAHHTRKITVPALDILKNYHWPGNVRELKNIMQMVTLQYPDKMIEENMMMRALYSSAQEEGEDTEFLENKDMITAACQVLLQHRRQKTSDTTPYVEALSWVEKPLILEALRITKGNQLQAAKLLGIHRNTLRTKLKSLNIL
jgi:two-component system nitrogen regulation response regulator GlnG